MPKLHWLSFVNKVQKVTIVEKHVSVKLGVWRCYDFIFNTYNFIFTFYNHFLNNML